MKNKILIEKDEFGELIDELNSMQIVKFFKRDNEIGISFNIDKVIGLISDIGMKICMLKAEFEKISSKEAQILLLLLNKPRMNEISSIELSTDYIICSMFFIENFYNYYSPIIENNRIIISIDEEVKVLLDSLDEIEYFTSEKYSLDYLVYDKTDKIELELAEPFKIALNDIRLKNELK